MAGLFVGQTVNSDLCQSLSAQDNSSEKTDETQSKGKEVEEGHGGWPYEFVDVVDKDLECNICLLPLRDPWLTDCGHNMCRTCLDKVLLQKNAFCPEDRNPISKKNVFPDKRFHRKVMSLKVKCPYAEMEPYACKWIGELNDLMKTHLDSCESAEVACTREICNEKLTRNTFRSHINDQCLWRERKCYYCLTPVVVCKLKTHEDMDCVEITVACSNTCGQHMSRKELNSHLENNCANRIVSCPFEDGGCKEKFAAAEIEKHIDDNIGRHLIVMYNKTKDQGQEIQMLKESNKDQDKEVKMLTKELNGARWEIEMLKNILSEEIKEVEIQELQLRLNHFSLADISTFLTFTSRNENKNILRKVINFLKAESIYDCHFMENAWSYRKDDKIVFIWFVNNFKLRQQEQTSNPYKEVESPDFCTGEKGHFMSVDFSPNGWGLSKGSDLSCSLGQGKRGPYDHKIKCPYDQLFRVTVINFKDRKDDVSVEKSFKVLQMFIMLPGSYRAILELLDLRRVNDFLLNDTIVLKIIVNHCTASFNSS